MALAKCKSKLRVIAATNEQPHTDGTRRYIRTGRNGLKDIEDGPPARAVVQCSDELTALTVPLAFPALGKIPDLT